MFSFLHACKYACASKIDVIKPIVPSSCVCTGHVHDSLQTHTCMSRTHMPNLGCMHSGVHANCKPRTAV